ncbi:MAG: hypothetical protein PCFJNLEI_03475 [Verrucomicrobiae bacterium]|nr:hypothetical protein [Verrucomicrobiae bacterium]
MTTRVCPACSTDNRQVRAHPYSRDEWQLKTCQKCRFVYLENAPRYEDLDTSLAWEKSLPAEKVRRRKEEPLLHKLNAPIKRFRKHVMKRNKLAALVRKHFGPGAILDVGCGSGRRTAELGEIYIPHGVEISSRLAAQAQELFASRGGRVVHNDGVGGLAQFPNDQFVGVIMCAYLEHEVQPQRALQEGYRVLRPGGRLIIKVPNYGSLNRRIRKDRWCGIRLPDHVNYFTPANLRQMVVASGLQVAQFNALDRIPSSDNMWLVAEKPR